MFILPQAPRPVWPAHNSSKAKSVPKEFIWMSVTIGCSRFGGRSVFQWEKDRKISNKRKIDKAEPKTTDKPKKPAGKSDYLPNYMSFNKREAEARLLLCRAASSFQLQQPCALATSLSNSRPNHCRGLGARNARVLPAWGLPLKWRMSKTPKVQDSCQKVCLHSISHQPGKSGGAGRYISIIWQIRKRKLSQSPGGA